MCHNRVLVLGAALKTNLNQRENLDASYRSMPKQVVKNLELHLKLERSVESQYNPETLAIVPGILLENLNRAIQYRSFTISGAIWRLHESNK